jgi:hypothetical protein
MKRLMLFIFALAFLNSCKESVDPVQDPNKSSETGFNGALKPTIENGYLKFADVSDFVSIIQAKKLKERDELILNFEKINGFTSFREKSQADTREVVNESILKLRKALHNPAVTGISRPDENLPPLIESLVNEKGLVRLGNSLFQFTPDKVKELKDFTGQMAQVETLINSESAGISDKLLVKKIEKRSLLPSQANARTGPYAESIQGGALYIPFYGTIYVRGYLTCTNVPVGISNNWIIQAESRAYTDANAEVTNVETYMEITSPTHTAPIPSTIPDTVTVSGRTRLQYVIGASAWNANFIGQIKYVIVMYPFGYTRYSVGYLNITS